MSPVAWKYKGNKWAHHHHQFFSPPMTVSVFMSKPSENLCIYDLCQYSKQSFNIDASILAPISAAFDLIAVRDEFHSKLIYKSSLIRLINRIINHSQFDGITCEITHTRTKNECLEIGDWSMWYAPAFFSVEFRYIFHIISISISSSHRNDARKGRGLSTHSNVYAKFRHKSSHFSRMCASEAMWSFSWLIINVPSEFATRNGNWLNQ